MIRYYLDQVIASSLSITANWQREVFLPSSFALALPSLSTSRHSATGSRTRARARLMFSHNMDYVNYGVHMWYINKGKCLYVDRLLHVVLLMGKKGQKWCKNGKNDPPLQIFGPHPWTKSRHTRTPKFGERKPNRIILTSRSFIHGRKTKTSPGIGENRNQRWGRLSARFPHVWRHH